LSKAKSGNGLEASRKDLDFAALNPGYGKKESGTPVDADA
jgi:hypothetical protein